MIWHFTRENAQVDLEVHRLPEGTGYIFAVTHADGSEKVENYTDAARLVTRVLSVQQRLLEDGWMPASPGGGRSTTRTPVRRRLSRACAASLDGCTDRSRGVWLPLSDSKSAAGAGPGPLC